ncbi:MAG: hypothetical protein ABIH92_05395 [Nanoarchaeota archaeon]
MSYKNRLAFCDKDVEDILSVEARNFYLSTDRNHSPEECKAAADSLHRDMETLRHAPPIKKPVRQATEAELCYYHFGIPSD